MRALGKSTLIAWLVLISSAAAGVILAGEPAAAAMPTQNDVHRDGGTVTGRPGQGGPAGGPAGSSEAHDRAQIQSDDWQVRRAAGFRIYHAGGDASAAARVARIAPSVAAEYSQLLEMPFPAEAFIFLVASGDKWVEVTQGAVPDWSDGFAKSREGIVYIRLLRDQNLEALLRHELIHIILGANLPPGSVPRWFEEGLASFCSSAYFMDHHAILSLANLSNSLLSLADIDEMLAFNADKAKLAYAQSLAGCRLILDAIGWDGVRGMLAEVRRGEAWPQVFDTHLAMSEADFEWYLLRHIADRFKWGFLIRFETLLWLLIPLLVVAGYITMRLRRKRVYRRWQAEDETLSEPESDE